MQLNSSGYNDIYATQEDIVEDIKGEENVYFLFVCLFFITASSGGYYNISYIFI